jgi:cell division protein FtsB
MPTPNQPKVPVSLSQGRLLFRMLKLNSSSVSLILVIVLGTFLVSQDLQIYLDQRRQIVEMEQSFALAEEAVEQLQEERDRWQDPFNIRSQARDRLYYVLPGEVSYLVMNSEGMDFSDTSGTLGSVLAEKRNADEISLEAKAAQENWVDSIIESVLRAALDPEIADEE